MSFVAWLTAEGLGSSEYSCGLFRLSIFKASLVRDLHDRPVLGRRDLCRLRPAWLLPPDPPSQTRYFDNQHYFHARESSSRHSGLG
jgi:hypothetical protein